MLVLPNNNVNHDRRSSIPNASGVAADKRAAQRFQLPIAMLLYVLVFALSYAVAFLLRFDFHISPTLGRTFWMSLPWVIALKLSVFFALRQFSAWWGHVSFHELQSLTIAAAVSAAGLLILNQLGVFSDFVPRSVTLIDGAATVLLVGALRSAMRWRGETAAQRSRTHVLKRALLVGASSADKVLALQLQSHPQLGLKICGFLDEQPTWVGRSVGGVPVLGTIDQLLLTAQSRSITEVIAIVGSMAAKELRRLRESCDKAGLHLHVLPPLGQLVGNQTHLPMREVDVETLLQRKPVALDETCVFDLLRGATVLVTGAGGSIGSEVCRQLQKFQPQKLILVDRSEPSLFYIHLELGRITSETQIHACLGDVTDRSRLRQIFDEHRPSIVFHVAAHKHVPLLETHVREALKNNVLGTANLVDVAESFDVSRFVYISTDKAVNPSSIMGATKRLAEHYVLAMSKVSTARYVAVRFGNVLGSAGSVVPLFQEQIRRGGPITITHPEMDRFFMTIPEAARLVLQASATGKGGEIFVLDMGEPVKIVDLAKEMIQQAGLPAHAIDIAFVGMRPGEKLSEELFFEHEERLATPHAKLFSVRHRGRSLDALREAFAELTLLVDGKECGAKNKLRELVPEYCPPCERQEVAAAADVMSAVECQHIPELALSSAGAVGS